MKTRTILVIDDDPDNFDVIETLLQNEGYTLHYVASGSEAIAALDRIQPDLILLDVMMPERDGLDVCRCVKGMSQWQVVSIIMVTALDSKQDLANCLNAGADDFITKPVSGLELRARVKSMLRLKEQYESIQALSNLQQNTISLLQNSLNELRGNLATTLPHELNTPLMGILGSLEFAIHSFSDLDRDELHEILDIAYQSALRLHQLTQKFLIYLKLEISPGPVSSAESCFALQTIGHVATSLAEKNNRQADLAISVQQVEVGLPHSHFQRLVMELVDNALKFSQPGTPIQLQGHASADMFHFWVRDRGSGMTQEQIGNLGAFMQFERQTHEQQGTGLGLKIVQKITELYGGWFLISSVYGQGTTVQIALPLAIGAPQQSS